MELFGEDSEEEDNDHRAQKNKALEKAPSAESAAGDVTGSEDGDDDDDEEELEFEEEISIIEPATDESNAVDEEACDVGSLIRPGEESFITDSPSSSSSLSPSLSSPSSTETALPSSVSASPYAPPSSSSSSARRNEKKQKKEDDIKVRERLRKKLGITAKRKPPIVKPRKLSTHRPLVL